MLYSLVGCTVPLGAVLDVWVRHAYKHLMSGPVLGFVSFLGLIHIDVTATAEQAQREPLTDCNSLFNLCSTSFGSLSLALQPIHGKGLSRTHAPGLGQY